MSRDTHIMLFQVPIMLCSYSQHQANYAHCFVPIMLSIAHATPTQLWGDGAFLHDCTAAPISLVMQSTLPCKYCNNSSSSLSGQGRTHHLSAGRRSREQQFKEPHPRYFQDTHSLTIALTILTTHPLEPQRVKILQ